MMWDFSYLGLSLHTLQMHPPLPRIGKGVTCSVAHDMQCSSCHKTIYIEIFTLDSYRHVCQFWYLLSCWPCQLQYRCFLVLHSRPRTASCTGTQKEEETVRPSSREGLSLHTLQMHPAPVPCTCQCNLLLHS